MTDELDPTSSTAARTTARAATAADIDPLARALARAFTTDPVWEFLCGANFADFEQRSVPFFAREIRHNLALDGVTTTNEVTAGALWAPPNRWKLGASDIARLVPAAVRLFGRRLPGALSVLGETDKVHPAEPHWYLGFLGTDPEHQGKGHGSSVLGPVLQRCDTEGVPAYLESSKEANVPFYERHGFEVTSTLDLAKGKGPRMWLMWRDPRPPEAD